MDTNPATDPLENEAKLNHPIFTFLPRDRVPSSISSSSPIDLDTNFTYSSFDKAFVQDSNNWAGVPEIIITNDIQSNNTPGIRELLESVDRRFNVNQMIWNSFFDDPFDGSLDSIKSPWETDPELNSELERIQAEDNAEKSQLKNAEKTQNAEPPASDINPDLPTMQIEPCSSGLKKTTPATPTEAEIDNVFTSPDTTTLKLTPSPLPQRAKSTENITKLFNKLEEVLNDSSVSNEKKVLQGRKLVRSLSDLIEGRAAVVVGEEKTVAISPKQVTQNQRSKSFSGLKKVGLIVRETRPSLDNGKALRGFKLPEAGLGQRLSIKKGQGQGQEGKRGPLRAVPLEGIWGDKTNPDGSIKTTPKYYSPPINGNSLIPAATSTPASPMHNKAAPKFPLKKPASGPMVMKKALISPSKITSIKKKVGNDKMASNKIKDAPKISKTLPVYKGVKFEKTGSDTVKSKSNKENQPH